MAKKIDDYKQITKNLIEKDRNEGITAARQAYDDMYNLVWELPTEELQNADWVQKRILKYPYDSIEAGKSAYATMEPNFSLERPGASEKTHERYNLIESGMQYHFAKASKRRYPVVATGLEHAMLYGEVIMQPIHIDAQIKLMGGLSSARERGIRKYGDFIINVHNPQNVYVRYTDFGIDCVVLIKVQTVAEFLSFWGDKGKPIRDRIGSEDFKDKNYIASFDYIDHETRAVWANPQVTNTRIDKDVDGLKIMNEDHGLPFGIPWAAACTPNRQGLLYPLYQAKGWELANLAESLMYSEALAYASAPRLKVSGMDGDVDVAYGEPGRTVHEKPTQKIEEMQPPELDQNLAVLTDRARTDMQLVPDIVISGNAPANSAFASINQLMQAGLGKFAPYREITERVLEDVGCLMLAWEKYLGKPMVSPIKNRKGSRSVYEDKFTLNPDEYEYEDILVTVELKPDMPVDRMAQIQAASQGVQYLGWDRNYANEQLGENEPEVLEERLAKQTLRDTELSMEVQRIQAERTLQIQAETMGLQALIALAQDPNGSQMLQQMAQQLAASTQMAEQSTTQGQGSLSNPENTQGLEGVTSNPAMGESPPSMMVPGTGSQSRATGRDRSGTQVA